nr:hypothetical protein [Akkermansia muciniphila]
MALPSGEAETKPGSLPDYECGYYYPLDLSSVWETAPLAHLPFRPERCLDMCAAPGGKSILAQTRVSPQEHVSNEVNPKRLGILRHNLLRCGFTNLYTQRLRPDQWAELAPGCFDLILADAPCSGQSLLAKGIPNPGCFNSSVTGATPSGSGAFCWPPSGVWLPAASCCTLHAPTLRRKMNAMSCTC